MATTDIPEYVKATSGSLIRSSDWNSVQQQTRNGVRAHRHTVVAATGATDTRTDDNALQITGSEIEDSAVTSAKVANDAITTDKLANDSVTAAKLAANSVSSTELQDNAVKVTKLAFEAVAANSTTVDPGTSVEQLVVSGVTNTKTTIYFPTAIITATTGSGYSEIDVQVYYRQTAGSTSMDLYIRIANTGSAEASVFWYVWTFAD